MMENRNIHRAILFISYFYVSWITILSDIALEFCVKEGGLEVSVGTSFHPIKGFKLKNSDFITKFSLDLNDNPKGYSIGLMNILEKKYLIVTCPLQGIRSRQCKFIAKF